jgi:hypothetical protein
MYPPAPRIPRISLSKNSIKIAYRGHARPHGPPHISRYCYVHVGWACICFLAAELDNMPSVKDNILCLGEMLNLCLVRSSVMIDMQIAA